MVSKIGDFSPSISSMNYPDESLGGNLIPSDLKVL